MESLDSSFDHASKGAKPLSGVFAIVDGALIDQDMLENASKELVINNDFLIDGSLCVGFDCARGGFWLRYDPPARE